MRDKRLSIAACTRKLDVDDRLALKLYYRAAGNLLKQASVYRDEGNIVELYVLLLRFSSLVSETVPQHREYQYSVFPEKSLFRKKLFEVLEELEALRPDVQRLVDQINKDHLPLYQKDAVSSIKPYHLSRNQWLSNYMYKGDTGAVLSATHQPQSLIAGNSKDSPSSFLLDVPENQPNDLSLNLKTPSLESLSRHSYFGPSLANKRDVGAWPSKVQYTSLIRAVPGEAVSLDETFGSPQKVEKVSIAAVLSRVGDLDGVDEGAKILAKDTDLTLLASNVPVTSQFDLLNQLFPPPVLAPVENVPFESGNMSSDALPVVVIPAQHPGPMPPSEDVLLQSKEPKSMHISIKMLDDFLKIARVNTKKNIETCGVLSGYFKKGAFYVSTLIVPKQEASSNTCEAINEEEIFLNQDKRGLFQLGWIHTHPSQSCFMSSVDLHTHYSYQVMLQEAIAIVMAPMDATRKYGIFRLTDPGGVKVIKQCQKRGFHCHEKPVNGESIYEKCNHVIMDPALSFEVIDLR